MLGRALLLLGLLTIASANFGDFTNKEWTRTIYLRSQIAKHQSSITVVNTGSSDATKYSLAIPENLGDKVSWIKVTQDGAKADYTVSPTKQAIQSADGQIAQKATIIHVSLPKAIKSQGTSTIKVTYFFGHTMEPYPAAISQLERQLVRYRDSHFVFSPYPTTKCTTTVRLASGSVQTSSQLQPTSVKNDTITYGPYENLKPFSHSPMMVHFENNKPFLTIPRLNREIDISHWGRVSIEETHHWRNDGAELKGGFSRYEYQINPAGSGHAAIKEVELAVPKNAEEVYYRDFIGNISTSHWHDTKFQLQPRFPIFGGWQTKFCWGYLIPTEQVLFHAANDATRFTLNITLGPDFAEEVIIDYERVLVFLPEGATDWEVTAPFAMKQSVETRVTTLDVSGRPVILLEKHSLVNEHNQLYLQVSYTFNTSATFRKPLSIAGGVFVVLLALLFFSRFRLSILPPDPQEQQAYKAKLAGLVSKYAELHSSRALVHKELEEKLAQYANSKGMTDVKGAQSAARKKLEDFTSVANGIYAEIAQLSAEVAEAVSDIEETQDQKAKSQFGLIKARQEKHPSYQVHEKNYEENAKALGSMLAKLVKDNQAN